MANLTNTQKHVKQHTHNISDITNLQAELNKRPTIVGGKIQKDSLPTDVIYQSNLDTALAGKADKVHTHTMGEVTGLTEALAGKASLVNGKIPIGELPSNVVDEVAVVETQAEFNATLPENNGKIVYVKQNETMYFSVAGTLKEMPRVISSSDSIPEGNTHQFLTAERRAQLLQEAATAAQQKADEAKLAAIGTAASDATQKADLAKQQAISHADTVATSKANDAKTQALNEAKQYTDQRTQAVKSELQQLINSSTQGAITETNLVEKINNVITQFLTKDVIETALNQKTKYYKVEFNNSKTATVSDPTINKRSFADFCYEENVNGWLEITLTNGQMTVTSTANETGLCFVKLVYSDAVNSL